MAILNVNNDRSFPRASTCYLVFLFSQAIFFKCNTESLFSESGNRTDTAEPLEPTEKLRVHVTTNGSVAPGLSYV